MHSALILFGRSRQNRTSQRDCAAQLDHSRAQFCHAYAAKTLFGFNQICACGVGSGESVLTWFIWEISTRVLWGILQGKLDNCNQPIRGKIPVYTIDLHKRLFTQTVMSFSAKRFFFLCSFSPSLCSLYTHQVVLFSDVFRWLLDLFFSVILEKLPLRCTTYAASQLV